MQGHRGPASHIPASNFGCLQLCKEDSGLPKGGTSRAHHLRAWSLGSHPSLTPPWLAPWQELLEKCHPLGMFDSIATLAVAANMRELYRLVLVDTPLAPYFAETLSSEDLDEMNIEILRNTLYKVQLRRPPRAFRGAP